MSDSKEITVAEQPQQLITIEPAKYVALVFESFRKKFDAYKAEADKITVDATTPAGMKVAVEYRAKFRDEIRIASESARKERKAPILEIGRLLDGAAKEIAEEVAPYESRFDAAIKAEEKRKDDEKIAKALAESARISAIRKRIAEIQAIPAMLVGKSSETIAAAIESLEAVEITIETHQEFAGEGEVAKLATVQKLWEMFKAQQEHEAEAARLQAERAQLERDRAEAAERERLAAIERQRAEDEQRIARAKAEAAALAERQAEQRKLDEQRAEFERQQAELLAQQQALREATEKLVREQREREEAETARIEAEARATQEAIDAAERAEAQRVADDLAVEAERREREAAAEVERAALEAEVARLHALHFANDGLGMLEDVLHEIVKPIGQECCGMSDYSECCGTPIPFFHDIDSLTIELNKWRDELIQRRAEQKEAA
ncbi:coiled-coil domain-containing protein [Paraburkholderia caffeinilytica]|uniref:hypothetical protein n=1 Tax=Paraburkholderia caffeinilytica TaxID=1761016 RepID=UPI0038B75E36